MVCLNKYYYKIYIYIYIYIYIFKQVWLSNKDTFCLYDFIKFLSSFQIRVLVSGWPSWKIYQNCPKCFLVNSSTNSNLKPRHFSFFFVCILKTIIIVRIRIFPNSHEFTCYSMQTKPNQTNEWNKTAYFHH